MANIPSPQPKLVPPQAAPNAELVLEPRPINPPLVLAPVPFSQRFRVVVRRNRWFFYLAIVPTILFAVYFGLIAADRYEVESRFVVRAPAGAAANQIASIMQGSSIIRSADDAYAVHAYISSRDAVAELAKTLDLPAIFNRSSSDLLWRYPGFLRSANRERLWTHFQRYIDLDFDHTTGISTLRVTAFRPEDARDIATALLDNSEQLINRLSERAQGDTVRTANAEVARLRAEAIQSQEMMTKFRIRESMVDPSKVSAAALETIARLSLEVAQTNAQLNEVQRSAPQSNQITQLKTRISAIEEQITKERQMLAGGDKSMANRLAEYERLLLEREFAERGFASALTQLEVARLESQRQRLFLERISTPGLPDFPRYPYRLLNTFIAFLLLWLFYRIVARLVEDVRTHAEA